MKSKPWNSDDPDFLKNWPRRTPLLGKPARWVIAFSLVIYLMDVALLQMLTQPTPAMAAPPAPTYYLPPSLPEAVPRIQEQDRFVKVAPPQLDERAIAVARQGTDERFILDPYRRDDFRMAARLPLMRRGAPPVGRVFNPRFATPPNFYRPMPIPPNSR